MSGLHTPNIQVSKYNGFTLQQELQIYKVKNISTQKQNIQQC